MKKYTVQITCEVEADERLVAEELAFQAIRMSVPGEYKRGVTSKVYSADEADEQSSDACAILRRDYWTSIRSTAMCIVDAIKSGELTDDSEVADRIHEDADGSYWVIYTHANYKCLLASDHDPTEDLEDAGTPEAGKLIPVMAYYCVQHDVTAQVEAELGQSPYDYFEEKASASDEASDDA